MRPEPSTTEASGGCLGTPNPVSIKQFIRRGLRWLLPRTLLTVDSPGGRRTVCLSFDDGPDPEHTPRLLDAMGEQGVNGIFFVIGRKAERYPELVGRMAAEGHLVGHHSYEHADPSLVSVRELVAEVHRTRAVLAEVLGRESRLFRPPFGKVTASKLCGLWLAGQTVVLWNTDPKDFASQSPEDLRDWFRRNPFGGGELVLLHDNHPHAATVLPYLADQARARGLTFYPPRSPHGNTPG